MQRTSLASRRSLCLVALTAATLLAASAFPSTLQAAKKQAKKATTTTIKAAATTTAKPAPAPTAAPISAAPAAPAPSGNLPAGTPAYYPADYSSIVEGSRKESKLLVYSILSKANWDPILAGFKKRYPWVEVEASDNDSATIFDKYYSETSSGARSADMIVTSSPDTFQEFVQKGENLPYKSPEDSKVPEWSRLASGVYTVSSDPMLLIWNKKLLPSGMTSMEDLSKSITANPGLYNPGRVVTYVETNATGFAAYWFWAKKIGQGRALAHLTAIGRIKPKVETSGGRMVDSTIAGETLVGVFVSAVTVFPKLASASDILGWSYIKDGTPIIVRGMSVTKKAKSPNSAKLLMDFIMSADGQILLADGGVTPYRADVAGKSKLHLKDLEESVGVKNLIPFSFDPELLNAEKRENFRAFLKDSLGR